MFIASNRISPSVIELRRKVYDFKMSTLPGEARQLSVLGCLPALRPGVETQHAGADSATGGNRATPIVAGPGISGLAEFRGALSGITT
jgi:hypothetical protein